MRHAFCSHEQVYGDGSWKSWEGSDANIALLPKGEAPDEEGEVDTAIIMGRGSTPLLYNNNKAEVTPQEAVFLRSQSNTMLRVWINCFFLGSENQTVNFTFSFFLHVHTFLQNNNIVSPLSCVCLTLSGRCSISIITKLPIQRWGGGDDVNRVCCLASYHAHVIEALCSRLIVG